MSKVKYGVWFHGNEQESEGICYNGKNPYIVDDKPLAEYHKSILQSMVDEPEKFSVCMIIIDDKEAQ